MGRPRPRGSGTLVAAGRRTMNIRHCSGGELVIASDAAVALFVDGCRSRMVSKMSWMQEAHGEAGPDRRAHARAVLAKATNHFRRNTSMTAAITGPSLDGCRSLPGGGRVINGDSSLSPRKPQFMEW